MYKIAHKYKNNTQIAQQNIIAEAHVHRITTKIKILDKLYYFEYSKFLQSYVVFFFRQYFRDKRKKVVKVSSLNDPPSWVVLNPCRCALGLRSQNLIRFSARTVTSNWMLKSIFPNVRSELECFLVSLTLIVDQLNDMRIQVLSHLGDSKPTDSYRLVRIEPLMKSPIL